MVDFNKEYGLVLEGGGAKGAYQVGVWKALKENGVKINAAVGTSVGALNGVLIVQDQLEEAIKIWSNIKYSHVIKIDDDLMDKLMTFEIKGLDLKNVLNKLGKILFDKGMDITPLKDLIAQILDEKKIRESAVEFGLVTVSLSDRKPMELFIADIPDGKLADFLLATSFLPVFKSEKLHGKRYVDGAFHNNLPVNMLIDKGYTDIIVLKIGGLGLEKKYSSEGINVVEIAPRENLGGLLEFDSKKTSYNIQLGYYDGLKFLGDLKGKKYYIDVPLSDSDIIKKIVSMDNGIKEELLTHLKYKNASLDRGILEVAIPRIAKKLELDNNWTYTDLVVAILEYHSQKLNLERFKVYTYDELVTLIKKKMNKHKEFMNINNRHYLNKAITDMMFYL